MPESSKVLVVGVGSIGERHLRCFQSTGRVQLALCESNHGLQRQIAKKYEIHQVYMDLDSLTRHLPFGFRLEPIQARNVSYFNNLRPPHA